MVAPFSAGRTIKPNRTLFNLALTVPLIQYQYALFIMLQINRRMLAKRIRWIFTIGVESGRLKNYVQIKQDQQNHSDDHYKNPQPWMIDNPLRR